MRGALASMRCRELRETQQLLDALRNNFQARPQPEPEPEPEPER